MEFFLYFFTVDIVKMIAEESNRAAITYTINTQFTTDAAEIYHYIGVLMNMFVYRYFNLHSYWGKNAFNPIQTPMPMKWFELIKKHLSLEDESNRKRKEQPRYNPKWAFG